MSRRDLAEGVYEHLITRELAQQLATGPHKSSIEALDEVDAPVQVGRHLGQLITRVLDELPEDRRAALTEQLVANLAEFARDRPEVAALVTSQQLESPLRQLRAVYREAVPPRPRSSLATSSLLTRKHGDPTLGHELAHELTTADQVDAIIAFVTMSGLRALREALGRFANRPGVRLRLLTTVYRGVTEIRALDEFARMPGAEVRISYDTQRTRLHAKAWLFRRNTGLTTAYIGSANLTSTALGAGQEWMVKVCAVDLPHVVDQFAGTFETLWAEEEFEKYEPENPEHRKQLREALAAENAPSLPKIVVGLYPRPFQRDLLDQLFASRTVHGRRRNLVVAATGTGKTVLSALDYAQQCEGARKPPLLFLAHREELLDQAINTFRHALRDPAFGELVTGAELARNARLDREQRRYTHVFASIQYMASSGLLDGLGAAHFEHVIIDECHHVPAASYQTVLHKLAPKLLVGLTATDERSDGKSLLPDFDHHVSAELRLPQALEAQLLVPFEYFGINDQVDLRDVRWTRSGYDAGLLGELYAHHAARADLVRHELGRRVADPRRVRALGFCVSIAHAEFMAQQFTAAGIPALAIHASSPERGNARRRLESYDVNVLFTCDLYNEGVDLPFVDTLLFLRPTQSATLFLQQLGRGLRHAHGKTSCLVLDFIGHHRTEFRFDQTLAALTGLARPRLREAVADDFPELPTGCFVHLDAIARRRVLDSLRSMTGGRARLSSELRELAAPSLADFLAQTGRSLDDVYKAGGWTTLREQAGLLVLGAEREAIREASQAFGALLHSDEASRLDAYRAWLREAPRWNDAEQRRMMMLQFQLWPKSPLRDPEEARTELMRYPVLVDELRELLGLLIERVRHAEGRRPVPEWQLATHCHYKKLEVLAAIGYLGPGDKPKPIVQGILKLDDEQRELLFVTLDKSAKQYSPTTSYRDYAISPERFHWETQSIASVDSDTGRRYIDSPRTGRAFYLFVRKNPDAKYAFLGPCSYESHTGDRPIAITWRLATPMPAALYAEYATLRPG